MKKYFLIALAAAFTFVACNPDPEVNQDENNNTEEQKPDEGNTTEPGATTLCINELCGVTGYKGVEFYNYGDKDINLNGWILKKNNEVDGGTDVDGKETYLYWKGTAGTVKANGFFILHAKDGDENLPALTPDEDYARATGGLSAKKAVKLELIAPDGTVVDVFNRGWDDSLGAAAEVKLTEVKTGSFARTADHGDKWAVLSSTFGQTNVGAEVLSENIPL